jgi:NAD(P)-dependent dehydrogenase (short-subunit alcohol dehydrogenase family)
MQKTAVVGGATGGIGEAVVGALVAAGYRVFALGRTAEKLATLQGEGIVPCVADLAGLDSLPAPLSDLDRLDALIHCAGVSEVASVEDTPRGLWDETFAVNVSGPAALTRALLPALRSGCGRIVFVNAAPGLRAVRNWSAYTASKAALRELADSLREEERTHGLRVTSIYPGGVRTELLRKVREQLGVPYDPAVTVSPHTLGSLIVTILAFPEDAEIMDVSLRPAIRPAETVE